MPEPKSKARIIARLRTERQHLEQNLTTLNEEILQQPGVVGEWSIKDVLAHLADWEAHMITWVEAARGGDPVAEIESGLGWKEFDAFNQRIYERHRHKTLAEVTAYFHVTHQRFMDMVTGMPEEEMLAKGRYAFLGKSSVYVWLGHYARHDAWGKDHIRKWLKQKQGTII